jgi:DNA-binding NtrC family response regulator
LQRLRRAVELSGLAADLTSREGSGQAILATGRLAQMAIDHLRDCNPAASRRLVAELQSLASPAECELLLHGRGYTYFHVVQYLYEFTRNHAGLPAGRHFCAEVGRAGGGLNINPERDISGLVRLLVAAMPPGDDGRSLALVLQRLGPMMAEKVFPGDLFRVGVRPMEEDRFGMGLEYADPGRVERALRPLGLEEDSGVFFLNSALQVQGTVRLGMDIIVEHFERTTRMHGLIEELDQADQEEIRRARSCWWTIAWDPGVRLRRPRDVEEVLAQLQTVYETMHQRELEYFQERVKTLERRVQALEAGDQFHDLVGGSSRMHQVYRTIRQVAATDLTVLVRGESGTGKELVARAIHQSSNRRDRPFVAANCAAFSETLLESELFGHEKGAFTGADRTKPGRFELAEGGTLFLDEVGDIPLRTQVKLLRVLETRSFERVGGTRTIQTDVRFVGATNRNLEELISQGLFREDLHFRLNVLPLDLPPLREHREDILQLAQLFLERSSRRAAKEVKGFSGGAVERLLSYSWPGNIRELQNVVERAVAIYAEGPTVTEEEVLQALGSRSQEATGAPLNLRQLEILKCLCQAKGGCKIEELLEGIKPAAQGAGLSVRTLQNDLRLLAELRYATWIKHGNARRYMATPDGMGQAAV